MESTERCSWCGTDPMYVDYHDNVWGKPVYDSKELFAKLCLDGQQAGLSWITILRKQQGYYRAFANFEPSELVKFNEPRVESLMQNSEIVRNRLKILSVIKNANGFITYENEHGENSFSEFLWQFVGGSPIVNSWAEKSQVPAETPESQAMSKALKKLGFSFVGPTICYAFMQAVGMVNDHLVSCPAYSSCQTT